MRLGYAEAIVAGAPNGLMLVSPTAVLLHVNPTFCRWLRYPEDGAGLLGTSLFAHVYGEDVERTVAAFQDVQATDNLAEVFVNRYRTSDPQGRVVGSCNFLGYEAAPDEGVASHG